MFFLNLFDVPFQLLPNLSRLISQYAVMGTTLPIYLSFKHLSPILCFKGKSSLFDVKIFKINSFLQISLKPIHSSLVKKLSGWWFGTFVMFPYIGNSNPNWLIVFRRVGQPPTSYPCVKAKSQLLFVKSDDKIPSQLLFVKSDDKIPANHTFYRASLEHASAGSWTYLKPCNWPSTKAGRTRNVK